MLLLGDCTEKLKELPDNSTDSIVTDPPAGISFMGRGWDEDKGGRDHWIAWMQEVATECKRVLKPGGHAFVWAIPRTSHWTATAWENAGFEIRDVVAHVFGSGFPKSLNVGVAVNKLETDEELTKGTSEYEGWGTALKPAREDWLLMRKPLDKGLTVAENCLKWGTGGINIDESRVETTDKVDARIGHSGFPVSTAEGSRPLVTQTNGRFPANLIHDNSEEVRECFPETKSGSGVKKKASGTADGIFNINKIEGEYLNGDSGNASRFFRAIPQVVDYNDFLIYNRSILTNIKKLCGQHLTKKKTDIILDGVIKEAEKFIQDAELLIFGNSKMEKFLMDTAYTIKTLTAQMTELKTLNVLPNWLIMKFTEDYEKTIKLLKELNTEDVKSAESINHLIVFKREMLELIRGIAKIVVMENSENGKSQTEKESTHTQENGNGLTNEKDSFFKSIIYKSKASKKDRGEGNTHPTVKSVALMEYLIKMVTPKGGVVLDPFMGSGSTGVAAIQNGFDFIGIEKDSEYFIIAERRINQYNCDSL